ncbi:MAG: hypothetical protein N3A69_11930, partial [Leptospiraceae bacterium]|nr:hypothetical protein [Leptospiraceae bacterium]
QRIKTTKNFWQFWKSSKNAERNIYLPDEIIWLGTNSQGKLAPDGRYIYQLIYEDIFGVLHKTKEQYLYLDSNFPIGRIELENPVLTPNADKFQDQLLIKQDFRAELLDRWKGIIRNENNFPLKTYLWESARLPKTFFWDGKDDRGIPMETGMYFYELLGEDFSENQFLVKSVPIYLDTEADAIHITFRNKFYPNEDNYYDNLRIHIHTSTNKKTKSWKLSIIDADQKEKRSWQGDNSLPSFIDWNGKDELEKYCKTGKYKIKIEAILENGKKISSKEQIVELIREPIELKFSVQPKDFTPDGDGVNDYLEIYANISNLEFTSWKLSLVEHYKTPSASFQRILKTWKGKNKIAPKILWDGLNENAYKVGSLANLQLYFSFRNENDEYKTFLVKEFQTGIQVNQISKNQLLISIPEYALTENELRVFSKVKKILENNYNLYKVEVQSHSRQKGDNKANLRKTEIRAKFVFEKMFPGIAINDQYSYRGFGEVEPLYKEEEIYFQEKNERIDFFMTLMEKE